MHVLVAQASLQEEAELEGVKGKKETETKE